ncbi:unnamed protein product [Amoebophrya sp. A25]|nr:unnamed protein product [Amoebophrya sp. A25]|eukprot:GSA25T00015411001.1
MLHLSYILRHSAEMNNMEVRRDGYVKLSSVMKQKDFKGKHTTEDVMAVCFFDSKARFSMIQEAPTGDYLVRANQGHTMKNIQDEELLEKIESADRLKGHAIHGTYMVHWPFIREQGLSKAARNHIHLAQGMPESDHKIQGMRSSAEVFIYVDVALALRDGMTFFLSKNGVILTPGHDGWLAPKYFKNVKTIDPDTQVESALPFEKIDNPPWAAELAPCGPVGDTYTVKNVEAMLLKQEKHLRQCRDAQRKKDAGLVVDPDELQLAKKADGMTAEFLSLEQRKRQQGGARNRGGAAAMVGDDDPTALSRKDRDATPPWKRPGGDAAAGDKWHTHGITDRDGAQWKALREAKDKKLEESRLPPDRPGVRVPLQLKPRSGALPRRNSQSSVPDSIRATTEDSELGSPGPYDVSPSNRKGAAGANGFGTNLQNAAAEESGTTGSQNATTGAGQNSTGSGSGATTTGGSVTTTPAIVRPVAPATTPGVEALKTSNKDSGASAQTGRTGKELSGMDAILARLQAGGSSYGGGGFTAGSRRNIITGDVEVHSRTVSPGHTPASEQHGEDKDAATTSTTGGPTSATTSTTASGNGGTSAPSGSGAAGVGVGSAPSTGAPGSGSSIGTPGQADLATTGVGAASSTSSSTPTGTAAATISEEQQKPHSSSDGEMLTARERDADLENEKARGAGVPGGVGGSSNTSTGATGGPAGSPPTTAGAAPTSGLPTNIAEEQAKKMELLNKFLVKNAAAGNPSAHIVAAPQPTGTPVLAGSSSLITTTGGAQILSAEELAKQQQLAHLQLVQQQERQRLQQQQQQEFQRLQFQLQVGRAGGDAALSQLQQNQLGQMNQLNNAVAASSNTANISLPGSSNTNASDPASQQAQQQKNQAAQLQQNQAAQLQQQQSQQAVQQNQNQAQLQQNQAQLQQNQAQPQPQQQQHPNQLAPGVVSMQMQNEADAFAKTIPEMDFATIASRLQRNEIQLYDQGTRKVYGYQVQFNGQPFAKPLTEAEGVLLEQVKASLYNMNNGNNQNGQSVGAAGVVSNSTGGVGVVGGLPTNVPGSSQLVLQQQQLAAQQQMQQMGQLQAGQAGQTPDQQPTSQSSSTPAISSAGASFRQQLLSQLQQRQGGTSTPSRGPQQTNFDQNMVLQQVQQAQQAQLGGQQFGGAAMSAQQLLMAQIMAQQQQQQQQNNLNIGAVTASNLLVNNQQQFLGAANPAGNNNMTMNTTGAANNMGAVNILVGAGVNNTNMNSANMNNNMNNTSVANMNTAVSTAAGGVRVGAVTLGSGISLASGMQAGTSMANNAGAAQGVVGVQVQPGVRVGGVGATTNQAGQLGGSGAVLGLGVGQLQTPQQPQQQQNQISTSSIGGAGGGNLQQGGSSSSTAPMRGNLQAATSNSTQQQGHGAGVTGASSNSGPAASSSSTMLDYNPPPRPVKGLQQQQQGQQAQASANSKQGTGGTQNHLPPIPPPSGSGGNNNSSFKGGKGQNNSSKSKGGQPNQNQSGMGSGTGAGGLGSGTGGGNMQSHSSTDLPKNSTSQPHDSGRGASIKPSGGQSHYEGASHYGQAQHQQPHQGQHYGQHQGHQGHGHQSQGDHGHQLQHPSGMSHGSGPQHGQHGGKNNPQHQQMQHGSSHYGEQVELIGTGRGREQTHQANSSSSWHQGGGHHAGHGGGATNMNKGGSTGQITGGKHGNQVQHTNFATNPNAKGGAASGPGGAHQNVNVNMLDYYQHKGSNVNSSTSGGANSSGGYKGDHSSTGLGGGQNSSYNSATTGQSYNSGGSKGDHSYSNAKGSGGGAGDGYANNNYNSQHGAASSKDGYTSGPHGNGGYGSHLSTSSGNYNKGGGGATDYHGTGKDGSGGSYHGSYNSNQMKGASPSDGYATGKEGGGKYINNPGGKGVAASSPGVGGYTGAGGANPNMLVNYNSSAGHTGQHQYQALNQWTTAYHQHQGKGGKDGNYAGGQQYPASTPGTGSGYYGGAGGYHQNNKGVKGGNKNKTDPAKEKDVDGGFEAIGAKRLAALDASPPKETKESKE